MFRERHRSLFSIKALSTGGLMIVKLEVATQLTLQVWCCLLAINIVFSPSSNGLSPWIATVQLVPGIGDRVFWGILHYYGAVLISAHFWPPARLWRNAGKGSIRTRFHACAFGQMDVRSSSCRDWENETVPGAPCSRWEREQLASFSTTKEAAVHCKFCSISTTLARAVQRCPDD